jgi:BRCA1-associated protein
MMSVPNKNISTCGRYHLGVKRAKSFEIIGIFTSLLEKEVMKRETYFAKIVPCIRHFGHGMFFLIVRKREPLKWHALSLNSPIVIVFIIIFSLTCGFVGCGRYSNKHSVAHFEHTRHPYSLELATLRVWDYCNGEHGGFVQRPDLLECPSSPPLSYPWMIRGLPTLDSSYNTDSSSRSYSNGVAHARAAGSPSIEVEKSSKKSVMIGEEYEALLQSALEDQAQHYEGEITKLRAELTTALVDNSSLSPSEVKETELLTAEIAKTRKEIEQASKELLEAQAQQAGLRETSQRLLAEQQLSNELLMRIQEEHRRENEQGKIQIEDLEQQIADLSANLRMRTQFSQNNELSNAQIFGTTSTQFHKNSSNSSTRRGKKKGRLFRK